MTERDDQKRAFLVHSGWADATRRFLAGDASDRSYDRVTLGAKTAVLMDAPPGTGDDPVKFVAIAAYLQKIGLSSPTVIAQDLESGFLLLEDLGDALFARTLVTNPTRETELYRAATDVLVHLYAQPLPPNVPDLTAVEWASAAAFVLDWYRFSIVGDRMDTTDFCAVMTEVMSRYADGPRALILRDFHAENLLWLPERKGLARVGLLDFQLAQAGQPGYDLVSLLQDARRDVQPKTEETLIMHYAAALQFPLAAFRTQYAVLGVQRALRILGVFARLCLVGGKVGYVRLIPRVWAQLQHNLAQPGLEQLARLCAALPPPTPAALHRIEAQCGNFR